MELPKVRTPEFERGRGLGFVPKDTVLPFVGGGGIVDVECRVVVRNHVHNVAEQGKVWDDACVVLPQTLAIAKVGLTKNEDAVHIRTNHGLDVHTVL